jgi:hypothetical protein
LSTPVAEEVTTLAVSVEVPVPVAQTGVGMTSIRSMPPRVTQSTPPQVVQAQVASTEAVRSSEVVAPSAAADRVVALGQEASPTPAVS